MTPRAVTPTPWLRTLVRAVGSLLTLWLTCTIAWSCNVPVFRYALEHWRPDAYRAVVFHRGELAPEDHERISQIQEQADARQMNLAVRTVDIEAIDDAADRNLLATCADAEMPYLVLQYPAYLRQNQPVWSGAVEPESLDRLFDSPARRELLKRLTDGQTAIWLLLETGNGVLDQAAFELLSAELQTLQGTLQLPELTDSPEDVLLDGPKLRIEFSILRILLTDPVEQGLVATLLAAEDDLRDTQEPMVFPVFGRGRALLPLIGAGISGANIRSSAAFLAGACSCQVKELNPGFDLLLTADWGKLMGWTLSPESERYTSKVDENAEPELVPIPSGSQAQTTAVELTTIQSQPESMNPAEAKSATRAQLVESVNNMPSTALWSVGGLCALVVAVAVFRRRA